MRIGFTGTRMGMNRPQMDTFHKFVCELPQFTEFHHGACIGADAETTDTVAEIEEGDGPRRFAIIAHPCDLSGFRSSEAIRSSDEVLPEKAPLDRNRDIVDACDLLVACPAGPEERRSGTWSTVRYARKRGKQVVVIWPDGTVTEEDHS